MVVIMAVSIGIAIGWLLREAWLHLAKFGQNFPDPISDETDGWVKMDIPEKEAHKLKFIRDYGVDEYIKAGQRGDLMERPQR